MKSAGLYYAYLLVLEEVLRCEDVELAGLLHGPSPGLPVAEADHPELLLVLVELLLLEELLVLGHQLFK